MICCKSIFLTVFSFIMLASSCGKEDEMNSACDNSTLAVTLTVSGNSISTNVSGGIAPYTYHWNYGATTPTISNLAPGLYSVTVTDQASCSVVGGAFVLDSAGCNGSSLAVTVSASGSTLTATATGGMTPYSYNWSNGANTQSISSLTNGTYTVTVSDNTSCSVSASGTVNVQTNNCITALLSKFSGTGLSYAINGNNVVFTTQDLPNHTSPYYAPNNPLYEPYNGSNSNFHINPNRISQQNIVFTIPLCPEEAVNKQATPLGPIGISVNGVPFFNQYAGPNNQPLTYEVNSFDQWLGHPQQTGMYHYHEEPAYLIQQNGSSAFLGLLSDGFPVYGPVENGVTLTSNDLDVYHGHVSATADFPNGIYHYHITADDPYINGNGFFGTPGTVSQ